MSMSYSCPLCAHPVNRSGHSWICTNTVNCSWRMHLCPHCHSHNISLADPNNPPHCINCGRKYFVSQPQHKPSPPYENLWTDLFATESATIVCPDCKGSKRYISLFTNEPCRKCNGSGLDTVVSSEQNKPCSYRHSCALPKEHTGECHSYDPQCSCRWCCDYIPF